MRFDNLEDWLHWQETLHPSSIELGLDRVAGVWKRLGPRQPPFPIVTIAGTNGKGSCAAMLDAIYSAAGYRTACYTSPHLLRYNERVCIGGCEATNQDLCTAFARVDEAREGSRLTYFEFGTLAAMDLFLRGKPDLAILEVGLGGRLDAVNLFDADLALVAGIGHDHTAWLGETIEQIAREKAGIFRTGRPAVIGHRDPAGSLLDRAAELDCGLRVLGRDFDWARDLDAWRWMVPGLPPVRLPPPALRGKVQYDNAASVLMAVSCLEDRLPVAVDCLRQGLRRVRISGRFQLLPGDVTWVLDVAHNAQAAECLAENLRSLGTSGRVHAVLGVLKDKEPADVAGPLMELVDCWHLGQASDARALPVGELCARLATLGAGLDLRQCATLQGALEGAVRAAGPGDCILSFGSFTTVEAAIRYLGSSGRVDMNRPA